MMSSFSDQIELFSKDLKVTEHKLIQAIRAGVSESVINRTPLDTGLARGNWQASTGSPATNEITRFDREAGFAPTFGSGESLRAAEVVAKTDIKGDFYIANSVPYIVNLEYGGSKQAPNGMVRRTVADFPGIIGDAISEAEK